MSAASWNKIVPGIVKGSLHHDGEILAVADESVRLLAYARRDLFKCLIAMKDRNEFVEGQDNFLAQSLNMHPDDFQIALEALLAPDPLSRNQEDDGSRVKRVPGGLMLTGGKLVRQTTGETDRRPYHRERRERLKAMANGVAPAPVKTGLDAMTIWNLKERKMALESLIAGIRTNPDLKERNRRGEDVPTAAAKGQIADYNRQIQETVIAIAKKGADPEIPPAGEDKKP